MSKNERLVAIKASRSRGVIDAININISNRETKSKDTAPPRNLSQSFAPTIYRAPQVRDVDGRGGYIRRLLVYMVDGYFGLYRVFQYATGYYISSTTAVLLQQHG
jgi:hypothetical protein